MVISFLSTWDETARIMGIGKRKILRSRQQEPIRLCSDPIKQAEIGRANHGASYSEGLLQSKISLDMPSEI